jgi:hypothetical protein
MIHDNSTGQRRVGGILRSRAGGALLEPVVLTVSTSVTAEVLLIVTDGDAKVQVAAVGQPLATLRVTVPVNPLSGVTLTVDCPDCPGAEMATAEGFADTPKSEMVTAVAPELEPA